MSALEQGFHIYDEPTDDERVTLVDASAQEEISDATRALLWRESAPHSNHFTDTEAPSYPPPGQEDYWKYNDYDSRATYVANHDGPHMMGIKVPIGLQPEVASPGVVLVDDLVRSRDARIAATGARLAEGYEPHPDERREIEAAKLGIVVVANMAERSDATVADGENGRRFLLGITDVGTEVYTTPAKFLRGLEDRNRLVGLYEVPADNSVYDADEQFRSGRVGLIRRHADELVPIFQYDNREQLLAAKAAGTHPEVIPPETRQGHVTHIDTYGNVRGEAADITVLQGLMKHAMGETVQLVVTYPENKQDPDSDQVSHAVDVVVGKSLKSAASGEQLTVYTNGSDHFDPDSSVGFFEVMARVNNPNTSHNTAIYQLLNRMPGFLQNIGAAELSLRI